MIVRHLHAQLIVFTLGRNQQLDLLVRREGPWSGPEGLGQGTLHLTGEVCENAGSKRALDVLLEHVDQNLGRRALQKIKSALNKPDSSYTFEGESKDRSDSLKVAVLIPEFVDAVRMPARNGMLDVIHPNTLQEWYQESQAHKVAVKRVMQEPAIKMDENGVRQPVGFKMQLHFDRLSGDDLVFAHAAFSYFNEKLMEARSRKAVDYCARAEVLA